MRKVLITGISGFVGKYLAKQLLSEKKYHIIGTYHSDSGRSKLDSLEKELTLEQLDLADEKKVSQLILSHQPDVVVHLAAQASAGDSFKNPTHTLTNNIIAELNLLEALRQHKLIKTRVLIVSSADIYGLADSSELPITETKAMKPISPYSVSKIAQDYLGLQYYLTYGLDIMRVRPFNHIGPEQTDRFVVACFAKQIAQIEKGEKEPVLAVGNLDAKRDFTDVRDVVKAYELLIEKGVAGEAYNVGSGKSIQIAKVLDMLLSLSNKKITVKQDESLVRLVDISEYICDYTKLHALTGWKPEIPLDKTLKDTLDYWRNKEE